MDRLVSVRIEGLRCVGDLTLKLDGLQVFVGENGVGKSSIVEAFEMLRRLSQPGQFAHEFYNRHGVLADMLTDVTKPLRLTVVCTTELLEVEYVLELVGQPDAVPTIARERVNRLGEGKFLFGVLDRNATAAKWRGPNDGPKLQQDLVIDPHQSALHAFGFQGEQSEVALVLRVLRSLEVAVPMEVGPLWAQPHEHGPVRYVRTVSQTVATARLARDGTNLASVFLTILGRGPEQTRQVLDDVRGGLGIDISHLSSVPSQSGQLQLRLHFGPREVPASQLSAGQLNFLALVAHKHLDFPASAVVWDEPELHLHPQLLARATWLLSAIAERRPVIVMTHADALLDALEEPERSVRVLSLNATRRTQVSELDGEALAKWRSTYRSIGELRRGGLITEVTRKVAS